MAGIGRDMQRALDTPHDLIVVGGGIYGAMLCLEAVRRRLRPLLLERGDFGAATSFNSLRILHGGLRYLQSVDLHRFAESVNERRWFMREFPGLVQPLGCLMPLYDHGLQRRWVMRAALAINDGLSMRRNLGVPRENRIARGSVMDARTARRLFPMIDEEGLKGAALWYDGCMPDSQRVLIEVVRRSCAQGACVLNYTEAADLSVDGGRVRGVLARDVQSGSVHEFRAPVVINATGPWSRSTARKFDRDVPSLFRSTLAWNILFDRKALSDYALAVSRRSPGAQTLFLHPWKGRLLAGTGHSPWTGGQDTPCPSSGQIKAFVDNLNEAVPGLGLRESEISRVFAGLLPASDRTRTKLAVREVMVDHGRHGGPRGLYSISGVKFTTSRCVAEKCLTHVYGKTDSNAKHEYSEMPPVARGGWDLRPAEMLIPEPGSKWENTLKKLIVEEAVVHLDDLVLRRTTLWEDPRNAMALAPRLCDLFNWDRQRRHRELARLAQSLGSGLPGDSLGHMRLTGSAEMNHRVREDRQSPPFPRKVADNG